MIPRPGDHVIIRSCLVVTLDLLDENPRERVVQAAGYWTVL